MYQRKEGEWHFENPSPVKNYIIFIIIFIMVVFVFIGCTNPKYPFVKIDNLKCQCDEPKLLIKAGGGYECKCNNISNSNVISKHISDINTNKRDGCDTKWTVRSVNKKTGEVIETCQGSILKDDEKSKVITKEERWR